MEWSGERLERGALASQCPSCRWEHGSRGEGRRRGRLAVCPDVLVVAAAGAVVRGRAGANPTSVGVAVGGCRRG